MARYPASKALFTHKIRERTALIGTGSIYFDSPSGSTFICDGNTWNKFVVGTEPVGKIIALLPSTPAPHSGFWRLCDGRTEIPEDSRLGKHLASQGLPRVTPNLSDSRFLMGGLGNALETGGSNERGLTLANMPRHDHNFSDPGHAHKIWGDIVQTFSGGGRLTTIR